MSTEKIDKYEAWIRELEVRQASLRGSRDHFRRLFVGALIASATGFFLSVWVGVGAFFTGLMFCAFGFYALRVRQDDYARELRQTRKEVARLRIGGGGS